MKKFLAVLFILAAFGAVVYYIGWTQFKVKPEQVGIVISKTDGISETPVENGKSSWYWQFLLPTNAQLKLFEIKPVNVTKEIKGQLPSGPLYSSIYNSADSFSYSFTFSFSVTLAPEALVTLLKDNKISNNEDLHEYLDKVCDSIAQLAADYYLKKASENNDFRPESVRRDDVVNGIKIYNECPEIEISTFALVNSKIPDYSLYRKLQTAGISSSVYNNSGSNSTDLESGGNEAVVY